MVGKIKFIGDCEWGITKFVSTFLASMTQSESEQAAETSLSQVWKRVSSQNFEMCF